MNAKRTDKVDGKERKVFSRSRGNVLDVMTICLYLLVLTIVMIAYMGNIQLLDKKARISQIARKYILRMETVGYLMDNDRLAMEEELYQIGAENLDFSGSTFDRVEFGSPILLVVRGQISGRTYGEGELLQAVFGETLMGFEERKMSTAKN